MSTICMHVCLVAWLCLTLCDPMNCGPPGSSVHGILQARILEWLAMPSSRGSFQPRDQTQVSCIAEGFFTIWGTREPHEYWSKQHIPSPGELPDPVEQNKKKSSLYNIVISIISFRIFSNLRKLHYVFKYMGRDWENICQIIDIIYHPSKGLKERIVFYILCFSCCLGFTTINTNFYLFKIDCQKQSFFFHCGKIFVLVYICL